MPKIQKNLIEKVQTIADSVKQDLRKKGVVVPVKHKDGSIGFDDFLMIKKNDGFYVTKDRRVYAEKLNLPQTAIIIANNLALGRGIDDKLIENDRWYGYRAFDEEVYTKSASNSLKNKNYDRADWCFTRASIARSQKESYKSGIMTHFNRLKLA